jgi:hypothetical protein
MNIRCEAGTGILTIITFFLMKSTGIRHVNLGYHNSLAILITLLAFVIRVS